MPERDSWKALVGTLGGVVLGLVLLIATWAKALDPVTFAEQIRTEGLDFLVPAFPLAILVIGLELALGLLLITGVRKLWVLVPSAALVAFFLYLTGRAYWLFSQGLLDEDAACGCFGNLVQRTPAEAFWQDLILLVPPLLVAFLGRPSRATPRWKLASIAAITIGGMLFAWRAPGLPLDDLATRLRPGVEIAEICSGGDTPESRVCLDSLVPPLAEGSHLVVIARFADQALLDALPILNEYAISGERGGVWLLSDDPAEEHGAFFWERGPAFEVREAPTAMLRPLYRTRPRSFRLDGGTVVETYAGIPTGEPPAAAAAGS